jgi:N-acetylglucosaminyl-diphospho-decaprenol L-rhamnosyltransferase
MTAEVGLPELDTESPDLSIIIVNWNVGELLRNCLQSLESGRGELIIEVIVIDNASEDGSPAMVREEYPWVQLVSSSENVGFPRGNNIGIANANGRFLLLLNPDTVILEDALTVLVSFMEANPDVGVIGPQLLNPDGSVQSSRRRFPTLVTAFIESTWLEGWGSRSLLRRYYGLDLPDSAKADVDWVTGASLMVRRDIIDQIGGMDEAYFMYSEELDWCRRIKDAGWRIVYLPTARVIHHEGKSSEQAVTARHVNFQRAKLRYFRKFHGALAATVLRLFLLGSYGWQLGLEMGKGILGHRRHLRWQRVKTYWQVLRSGLRPAGYS